MLTNKQIKKQIPKLMCTAVMLCLSVVTMLPFIWMLSTSFKFEQDVFNFPIEWIPTRVTLDNYIELFYGIKSSTSSTGSIPFSTFFMNSIKITSLCVAGSLVTSIFAAYAFAKLRFKGRDIVFMIFLATIMFPNQVLLVPKFLVFRELGIYNTHWALILPGIFSSFGTFMLRSFFEGIPDDLIEAAKIDGSGHLRILWTIVVPLSKAAIMALFILQFVTFWNWYEDPLVFLNSVDKFPIPLALALFQTDTRTSYGVMMAAATVSLVPIFVVFCVAQKHFVQGITFSGIKG